MYLVPMSDCVMIMKRRHKHCAGKNRGERFRTANLNSPRPNLHSARPNQIRRTEPSSARPNLISARQNHDPLDPTLFSTRPNLKMATRRDQSRSQCQQSPSAISASADSISMKFSQKFEFRLCSIVTKSQDRTMSSSC